jgi:hypothetical protein
MVGVLRSPTITLTLGANETVDLSSPAFGLLSILRPGLHMATPNELARVNRVKQDLPLPRNLGSGAFEDPGASDPG